MTYTTEQRAQAAAWKATTECLPIIARQPAAYINKKGAADGPAHEFCLPAAYADLNLLPEVRARALSLFGELGIPWHAGVGAAPSNHLLSSQVQCVNALGQMVTDPERIIRAFGSLLGIEKVLEIEPGRFLTFEYIGPKDYFGEVPNGARIRGAHCTSVDAAFLHRALDGVTELVLVEWKYTESYRLRAPNRQKEAVRQGRYGQAVADPAGPVRDDVLPFPLLVDEPIYQLVRQQLLAHALEQDGAEGAGRVRVVHVAPAGNQAYQDSVHRPEHTAVGATVSEVWHRLLRHPDRFLSLDSAVFADPEITSRDYAVRYAHDVIYDPAGLLAAFELSTCQALEDILYADHEFNGDVTVTDTDVELLVGREGTFLSYPFTVTELRELADELAVEPVEDTDLAVG